MKTKNLKKTNNYIFICFLLLNFNTHLSSQQNAVQPSIKLPVIIPPSPTAQQYMRYGEIPVDYSTGVPKIEIPIFNIKTRKLELPISISYHASGIKVNDIASEVGLGWVLNCGGIITRTVFGKRDETRIGTRVYKNSTEISNAALEATKYYDRSCACYSKINTLQDYFENDFHSEDPYSDRFFYNLPNGMSGIFRYDLNNNSIIKLPYRPVLIDKTIAGTSYNPIIDHFKIIDENGTTYVFRPYQDYNPENYTEWYLSKMISSDRTDSIEFLYSLNTAQTMSSHNYSQILNSRARDITYPRGEYCNFGVNSPFANVNNNVSYGYQAPLLETIISSNSVIRFVYTNDRLDYSFLRRLSMISISNKISNNEKEIKKIQFFPKHFGASNFRLGLDFIKISSSSDPNIVENYSFKYEEGDLPPYTYDTQGKIFNEDYWGYNNASYSQSLIPECLIPKEYADIKGGSRKPNVVASKACLIKEIKYPTGGRTEFSFERHIVKGIDQIDRTNTEGYAGGFRIQKITNYNEKNEIVSTKEYEYQQAWGRKITADFFSYTLQILHNLSQETPSYGFCKAYASYYKDIFVSSPMLPIEVAVNLPVVYSTVIEYNGTKTKNSGKTVYEYTPPLSPNNFNDNPQHPTSYEAARYIHPYHYDRGNYIPELKSKLQYLYDGSVYNPVVKTFYEYSSLFSKEYQTGIHLVRPIQYIDFLDEYPSFSNSFVAIDTKAYEETKIIRKIETYTFDPKDSTKFVLTKSDRTYNEIDLQLRSEETFSSKNELLRTEYKHPLDYCISDNIYCKMVNKNILSPIICTYNYNSNNLLNSLKTNYNEFNSNSDQLYPGSVVYTKGAFSKTLLLYNSYDANGNILDISNENDINFSYIWGYNKTLPIAKIENATNKTEAESYDAGSFYSPPLNSSGDYILNGNCNMPVIAMVNVIRTYYKEADHCCKFTLKIYNSQQVVVATFVDEMGIYQSSYTATSQISLPVGQYTARVSYLSWDVPEGSTPNDEIYVTLDYQKQYSVPFHTSFEEDINGISTAYSKTGRKCHSGSYTITLPARSPAGNNDFILSYWRKLNSSSNWEFYKENISLAYTISEKTIGQGYTYIDEVRLYPTNAKISTYTYDPLIGMTSSTDANDITTYYEYDSFGRLMNIRDDKNNILKHYDYHYKQ